MDIWRGENSVRVVVIDCWISVCARPDLPRPDVYPITI
jgi:hypothetical protein